MTGRMISFIFSMIEATVMIEITGSVLPGRYRGCYNAILKLIVVVLGAVCINVIGENTYTRGFILLMIFGIFICILYIGNWMVKLFYLLFAQYICMSSELLLSNCVMLLSGNAVQALLEDKLLSVSVSILIKLVVIVAGIFFAHYINKLNPHLPEKYWIILDSILFAIIECVELISGVSLELYEAKSKYLIYIIAAEYIILLLGLFVIYFLGKICWVYEKQTEYELTQLRENELQKIVTYQNQVNLEIEKIRHDMKGNLNNVRFLVESGQISEVKLYIDSLTEKIDVTKQHTFSGNHIIDVILNKHLALCNSKQIDLVLSVDTIPELDINPVDLSAILDNLLDNAIEAVEKISENQRKIEVKIFSYKENLTAVIKNQYCGELRKKKGKLLTNKVEWENHGYGIRSANDAAVRNNGSFKYYTKDKYFVSVFMIPLKNIK
ncbi:GHKL domain-containing protein [Roseburia faecis]|uniref:GHKL domain-containing protein n=1 Tax=Roseburia faecis TaxID=301302 RepID=UPI001920FE3F|nr:GHKL domain-containing protein [Roseburia faecis]